MRLGALLALAAPAASQLHPVKNHPWCDKDCVCDGVDLSHLRGNVFEMPEINLPDPENPGPVTDSWSYRISVCAPLSHAQIPAFCENDRHSPHVIRFKTADSSHNASHPTPGDCQRVGMDIVVARASHTAADPSTNPPTEEVNAVQLVFTSDDEGRTHIVTADLSCESAAGDMAPPSGVTRTVSATRTASGRSSRWT